MIAVVFKKDDNKPYFVSSDNGDSYVCIQDNNELRVNNQLEIEIYYKA